MSASASGQDGGAEAEQVEQEQVGQAFGSDVLSSNRLTSSSHAMVCVCVCVFEQEKH